MRLSILENGHAPEQKRAFAEAEQESGTPTADAILSLAYRMDFFGSPYTELLEQVMHGDSPWSRGERELFAAFISAENQCPF